MSTKTIQGKLWSVAPSYWAQHFEPWFLPMYKTALKKIDLKGKTLLDAGCGSGLFSSMAIAEEADVKGIDAAPGLLDVARRRNPDHTFLEGDLEALPFANDSFQVVTGFNSFQYAGNFETAVQEAKRVLKPGGQLVIGIWDKPEMSDATDVLKSIGILLPPPPPGTPGPFALSEDGKIEGILEKNGLRVSHKIKVPCPFLYASLSDGVKSFMGTGPAAAAINQHDTETVEYTIANALAPFRLSDDFHFLQNNFLLFIAEKVSA
jgi:SAM-dependent methyltransferase